MSTLTRVVHILVVPNPYLWRKPQAVALFGPTAARFQSWYRCGRVDCDAS